MVQSQLQPPRSKRTAWNKCLSVCVSISIKISFRFFGFGFCFVFFRGRRGRGRENIVMIVKEREKIAITGACGGRRLHTDLQCI